MCGVGAFDVRLIYQKMGIPERINRTAVVEEVFRFVIIFLIVMSDIMPISVNIITVNIYSRRGVPIIFIEN